jgi:hypothetical protein
MKRLNSLIHVTNSTFLNDVVMAYDNRRLYFQGAALRTVEHAVRVRNRRSERMFKYFAWAGYKQKHYTVEDIVQIWEDVTWRFNKGTMDMDHPGKFYYRCLKPGCHSTWVERILEVRESIRDQIRNQGSIDIHMDTELYNYIIRNASA